MTKQAQVVQYNTTLEFFDDEKAVARSITYLVNMNALESSSPDLVFLINRQQVYINGENPGTLLDKCIDYSGKCIFPVVVNVSAHDGRVQMISNTADIHSRWLIAKDRLYLDYKGPVVDKIVEQMEQSLSSAEFITKSVKSDLFFQLYFFPLYARHSHIKGIEMNHEFSIVPNSAPVKFIGTREIMNKNADGISIEVKGKINDTRSFTDIAIAKINSNDLLETNDYCQGAAQLHYELFSNGLLKSVKGYLEIKSAEDRLKRIEVSIIRNEHANLTGKDFEPAIKSVVYAKKKTFWSRFK